MSRSSTASSLPARRIITALLGCILIVWLIAYTAGDWTAYQFEHCSNLTQAEVVDKWRHFVNDGAYYHVRYRYLVSPTEQVTSGERWYGTTTHYDALTPGDVVIVCYLQRRPQKVRLTPNSKQMQATLTPVWRIGMAHCRTF